jgi:hypothetical protein
MALLKTFSSAASCAILLWSASCDAEVAPAPVNPAAINAVDTFIERAWEISRKRSKLGLKTNEAQAQIDIAVAEFKTATSKIPCKAGEITLPVLYLRNLLKTVPDITAGARWVCKNQRMSVAFDVIFQTGKGVFKGVEDDAREVIRNWITQVNEVQAKKLPRERHKREIMRVTESTRQQLETLPCEYQFQANKILYVLLDEAKDQKLEFGTKHEFVCGPDHKVRATFSPLL